MIIPKGYNSDFILSYAVSNNSDFLVENLSPDVAVHIEAVHSCMTIRGVRTPNSKTNTTRLTGLFKTDVAARSEFMSYIK